MKMKLVIGLVSILFLMGSGFAIASPAVQGLNSKHETFAWNMMKKDKGKKVAVKKHHKKHHGKHHVKHKPAFKTKMGVNR